MSDIFLLVVTSEKMQKYLYGFSLLELGPVGFRKLAEYFEDWQKAWQASADQLVQAGLREKSVQRIVKEREKINLEKQWLKLQKSGLKFITVEDSVYPKLLQEIASPPFLLFYLGNLELLQRKQLAVIGARRFTEYGRMVVNKIVPELVQAGLVITSGLAQGIDSLAHQACLQANGFTVAVLGMGLAEAQKNSYQQKLISEIVAKGGLVVSEYHPFQPASNYTFPARNRIVSGLSLGVLVVEAGLKSGTSITANYALEQNRELFAVPGSIFSDKSIGTHHLLKQGAQLVTGAGDILESFNFFVKQSSSRQKEDKNLEFEDEVEEKIYSKLSGEPISLEQLIKSSGLDSATVAEKVSFLEIKGLAKNVGGGKFIRL